MGLISISKTKILFLMFIRNMNWNLKGSFQRLAFIIFIFVAKNCFTYKRLAEESKTLLWTWPADIQRAIKRRFVIALFIFIKIGLGCQLWHF